MTENNVALVLVSENNLQLQHRDVRKPGEGEVLIAVHSVGICGSDVHYWKHGRIGNFIVKSPLILGHESSGTILEVGHGVTNLKPGDRVAVEPGVPCYKCQLCITGRYNLCADVKFLATPPIDGDLSTYHIHDANFCFKLPDNVSFEEGALVEPLSVAVHACRRGNVTLGSSVLICGAGPIGLVNLLVAKSMGAGNVVIIDVQSHRLDLAESLGATQSYLLNTTTTTTTNNSLDETALKLRELFDGGSGPDIVIECSGAETSVSLGMKTCRSGGTLVLVGVGPKMEMNVPLLEVGLREIDIKGIFRYCNCYPAAISLLAQGRVDVKKLITHRFTLSEGVKAFETASDPLSKSVKVMISCVDEKHV